jgi:hypothetical protein
VALLVGPLVLFAPMNPPEATPAQLLAVKMMAPEDWQVRLDQDRVMKMMPFTAIEDHEYTTYLRVS